LGVDAYMKKWHSKKGIINIKMIKGHRNKTRKYTGGYGHSSIVEPGTFKALDSFLSTMK
jgi:hypothetical protein